MSCSLLTLHRPSVCSGKDEICCENPSVSSKNVPSGEPSYWCSRDMSCPVPKTKNKKGRQAQDGKCFVAKAFMFRGRRQRIESVVERILEVEADDA